MRPYYLVVTVLQDKNESVFTTRKSEFSPSYYSYVVTLEGGENLKSVLNHIGGLQSANLRDTKKAAVELAHKLNESHKANGQFLYE